MNNSIAHFSKYAVSKKHTLNIIGGEDGGGGSNPNWCNTCGQTYIYCPYGCKSFDCPSEYNTHIGYRCAPKGSVG